MKKLTWHVVRYDPNRKCFRGYNVLSPGIVDAIVRKAKVATGRRDFENSVRDVCRYHFAHRTECEIILEEWPIHNNPTRRKVDVYDQLFLNWDRFIDYLWANLRDGENGD